MKRRGFLQLLGGALSAPLLPPISVGAASASVASAPAYPALAMKLAMDQAKHRVSFSVFSMAQQLGLPIGQAEALMVDLSKKGIVGPLQGATQSGRWAQSKLWQRPTGSVVASGQLAQPRTHSNTPNSIAQRVDAKKEMKMEKFEKLSGIAAPMPRDAL